eukprot:1973472-Pyramimonas_sp.AAC.1
MSIGSSSHRVLGFEVRPSVPVCLCHATEYKDVGSAVLSELPVDAPAPTRVQLTKERIQASLAEIRRKI